MQNFNENWDGIRRRFIAESVDLKKIDPAMPNTEAYEARKNGQVYALIYQMKPNNKKWWGVYGHDVPEDEGDQQYEFSTLEKAKAFVDSMNKPLKYKKPKRDVHRPDNYSPKD